MKRILLLFFQLMLISSLSANFTFTNNFIIDEPDCDPPPFIQSDDLGSKSFSVEMDWSGDPGSFIGYYNRTFRSMWFLIKDESGEIVKEVYLGYGRVGSKTFHLNSDHLQGLASGVYTVDLKTVYTFNGNSPNPVFMKVQRNGTQVAQADLDSTDPFEVIFENVDCFEYFYCGSASLYVKLKQMRSSVSGGSGNYTYSWIVDCKTGPVTFYNNVDRVPIAPCCATYFLQVTDNVTGCTINTTSYHCGPEEIHIGLGDLPIDSLTSGGGTKGFAAEPEDITIFPNPVQDVLVLSLDLNNEESRIVQVMNNQGRVLYSNSAVTSRQSEIPMSDFPVGVYFLRSIDQAGNIVTKKFIKSE